MACKKHQVSVVFFGTYPDKEKNRSSDKGAFKNSRDLVSSMISKCGSYEAMSEKAILRSELAADVFPNLGADNLLEIKGTYESKDLEIVLNKGLRDEKYKLFWPNKAS
ncbi:MAG: hypothetical protein R2684_14545 [Pyrinomonadaceae bacterium]